MLKSFRQIGGGWLLVIGLLVAGCAGSGRLRHSSPQEAFERAMEFYNQGKYDRAIEYFKAVFTYGRTHEWAADAQFYLARATTRTRNICWPPASTSVSSRSIRSTRACRRPSTSGPCAITSSRRPTNWTRPTRARPSSFSAFHRPLSQSRAGRRRHAENPRTPREAGPQTVRGGPTLRTPRTLRGGRRHLRGGLRRYPDTPGPTTRW